MPAAPFFHVAAEGDVGGIHPRKMEGIMIAHAKVAGHAVRYAVFFGIKVFQFLHRGLNGANHLVVSGLFVGAVHIAVRRAHAHRIHAEHMLPKPDIHGDQVKVENADGAVQLVLRHLLHIGLRTLMAGFFARKGNKAQFRIRIGGQLRELTRHGQHTGHAAGVVARAGNVRCYAVDRGGRRAVVMGAHDQNISRFVLRRQNGFQILCAAVGYVILVQRAAIWAKAQINELIDQMLHRRQLVIGTNRPAADFFRKNVELVVPVIHILHIVKLRAGRKAEAKRGEKCKQDFHPSQPHFMYFLCVYSFRG